MEDLNDNEHVLQLREEKKCGKIMRKQCKSCYSNGKRKDTIYVCTVCEGSPGYCLDCARITHNMFQQSVRKMSYEGTKGVTLESVIKFLEEFAPKNLAESWDNTGLLIEPTSKQKINNILLTNDLTEDVIKEALQVKANLIVSYHPPIFQSLKSITMSTWKGRIIGACLENKIAVYSPHTSWDSVPGGVNDWLASAFDCQKISPIQENTKSDVKNAGVGRYCKLNEEITLLKAVNNVKNLIAQPHIQIAFARGATPETKIKDVAICAGSGSSVLNNFPAQLYVTGEMSHHSLLDATHGGSSVILCNHSNSERGFLKKFKQKLEEHFGGDNVRTHVSIEDRDPLKFI